MTDVMAVGGRGDTLPGPRIITERVPLVDHLDELEWRIRDLELVCKAQQKALNFVIVRWMKASDQRDLKEKIWPDLEAAEMILNG
jgi:hypothetical protein